MDEWTGFLDSTCQGWTVAEFSGVRRCFAVPASAGGATADCQVASPRVAPGRYGTATTRPHPSIVVGRCQGTVVVTVHGAIDSAVGQRLGHVLDDLIDGQGNLSLIVDLRDSTVADARPAIVFSDAIGRVEGRGGWMTLHEPPALLRDALALRPAAALGAPSWGASSLDEVPRRG